MNQGLAGVPGKESSDDVGVDDVGQLVALPGEAPDVPTEGLTGLLMAVLEVPWVPKALVCALEVPHKGFPQIRPTLNGVGRYVLQLRSS